MDDTISQVPNTFPDLFWGYTVVFVLLVLYVISIGRRLSRLEDDVESKLSGPHER